jgi:hypothetical protein
MIFCFMQTYKADLMTNLLHSVDGSLSKYQADHHGERPLYILVSPEEIDDLLEEVKKTNGNAPEMLVTTYKGSKIARYEALNKGDLLLTNELPETSS